MRRILISAVMILAAAGAGSAQQLRQVPPSPDSLMLSYAPIVRTASPAVVNVYASRTETSTNNPLFDDPIFQQFFGNPGAQPRGSTVQSLGSGVIVDPSGLIVTNYHVIEGMTDVKVALSDHRELPATIVLRDQRTDLAVLRIKGDDKFPTLALGDSDNLEVGDVVLAVGDPFGVGQTVTHGIVSALARTQVGISDYGFFIQTDAAINPGNSGGALVDMQGRLVGINSAIYSRSGGSIGIGFAIPVNMVKTVVAAARGGVQEVRRPWLGASLQILSKEIADSLGLDRPSGALVADVASDGPAAAAGLQRGDIITAVDGQSVDDPTGLNYRIGMKPLGGTATLAVMRDNKPLSLSMKLMAAPETPPRETVSVTGNSPFSGVTVVNISPAVADEMALQGTPQGVVVTDIADGSVAADVGVQKGDIIVSVNNAKIARTSDLQKATSGRYSYWKITISRGGQTFTTVLNG